MKTAGFKLVGERRQRPVMNITNQLNKMDCTFYFILKEEDKSLVLKEETQQRICKKLEDVADVRFYGMRSGPDVRSAMALQEEFKGTIPEQINIIFIDREKDMISLLSTKQRDIFFERVMETTVDLDTAVLAEEVIKETEKD